MAFTFSGISPATVSDEGGPLLACEGTYDTDQTYVVTVEDGADVYECWGGAIGGGFTTVPTADDELVVVVPPVPVGTYDVRVVDGIGGDTVQAGVLTVIRHTYTTVKYSLTASTAGPRYSGPRSVGSESEQ